MGYEDITAKAAGEQKRYVMIVGRIEPGNATFCRTTTDDTNGLISAYLGRSEFTADKLDTFGGYGVMQIPRQ